MDVLPQGAAPPHSDAFSGSSEQPHPRSAATFPNRPGRRNTPQIAAGQPAHTGRADRAPGLDLPASLSVQLAGGREMRALSSAVEHACSTSDSLRASCRRLRWRGALRSPQLHWLYGTRCLRDNLLQPLAFSLRLPLSSRHRCDLWNKQINGGDPEGRADLRRHGSDLRSGGSAGSPALGTREARGAAAKTSHSVPRGPSDSHRGQCPPGSV